MSEILSSRRIDWDVRDLIKRMKEKNVIFSIPEQRGEVWNKLDDSKLIHSILKGLFINSFIFNYSSSSGVYEGLEGQQRANALLNFVGYDGKDGFKLHADTPTITYKGKEYQLAKHKFEHLPDEFKDRILRCPILIMCYDDLSKEDKALVFERSNLGRKVTIADINRIKVKSRDVFIALLEHKVMSKEYIGAKRISQFKHEDIIKNIWCLCFNNSDSLLQKDTAPVLSKTEVNEEQEEILSRILDYMLSLYNEIKKPKYKNKKSENYEITKKLFTRMINMTHMPMLGYMAYLAIMNEIDEEEYKEKAIKFFSGKGQSSTISAAYNQACLSGSSKPEQVRIRKNEIERILLTESEEPKQLKMNVK